MTDSDNSTVTDEIAALIAVAVIADALVDASDGDSTVSDNSLIAALDESLNQLANHSSASLTPILTLAMIAERATEFIGALDEFDLGAPDAAFDHLVDAVVAWRAVRDEVLK